MELIRRPMVHSVLSACLILGCVSSKVGLSAEEKQSLGLKIYMYTKNGTSDNEVLLNGLKDLEPSGFNRSLPVLIIVHGYQSTSRHDGLQDIKNVVLSTGGYNVMMLDYSLISMGEYAEAVARMSDIGREVADLVARMETLNLTRPEAVTLVGFSLGAQVAASVGFNLRTRHAKILARIIGLDPAKPSFEEEYVGPNGRLDKSDAEMVIVIHTAGGLIAYDKPAGHADFFPNGGWSVQPPCKSETKETGYSAIMDAMAGTHCSHTMAVKYFIESVKYPAAFLGVLCHSMEQFNGGNCPQPETVRPLGLETHPSTRGSYYLRTSSKPPYGLGEDGIKPETAAVVEQVDEKPSGSLNSWPGKSHLSSSSQHLIQNQILSLLTLALSLLSFFPTIKQ